ncbi:MAG TPA: hypothetical protein VMT71_00810 [Syntrophorhabdales bacterium]|nr:hypothetical protein [Syntrophorhabdales bacterium]
MKKAVSVVLAVMLVVAFAQVAAAQEQKAAVSAEMKAAPKEAAGRPGAVVAGTATVTATIDAIDAATRKVTLKYPDGTMQTITCGPEVRNFDQMKVGDLVKTTYAQSVAIWVRKSTEKPAAAAVESVKVAPKGDMPHATMTKTTEITATVEGIDYKKRTVTLKGPEGNVRTYPVDKRVKRLNEVKVGDEVVLRVTEAFAIKVERP